jgi:hypothetical protein
MVLLAVAAFTPLAACDFEWGGATVALINPAPVPEPTPDTAASAAEIIEPLPTGDLLYLVRFTDGDGAAMALPIARMEAEAPAALELPEEMGAGYRTRFDSAFYATDLELPLHAGGHRIGTLILDGSVRRPAARCLSVGSGRVLLRPDTEVPEYAFAWAGEGSAGEPVTYDIAATDTRMKTFGPVLAENLLRRGGENRPYLAQRAAMRAVPWPGDERPAMAATYLVNDQLDSVAPANAASSLFVLARFDGRQYVPEWSEVRRYRRGEGKEAFVYFGAIAGPGGRVDFVTRHDGASVRLAASVDREDEDREIDWTEPGACPGLDVLTRAAAPPENAAPAAAPPAGG